MSKKILSRYKNSATYVRLINSKRWRELRMRMLAEHPICELCLKQGVIYQTGATEVHHIVPVDSARTEEEAERLAFSESNLMCLCRKHHNKLHADEHSHSAEAHQKRAEEELARWIGEIRGANCGGQDKSKA